MRNKRDDIEMNGEDDSDLDIQALFQKYLDDTAASSGDEEAESEEVFDEAEEEEEEVSSTKSSGGFFSRLLHMASGEEDEAEPEEEEVILPDEMKEEPQEEEPAEEETTEEAPDLAPWEVASLAEEEPAEEPVEETAEETVTEAPAEDVPAEPEEPAEDEIPEEPVVPEETEAPEASEEEPEEELEDVPEDAPFERSPSDLLDEDDLADENQIAMFEDEEEEAPAEDFAEEEPEEDEDQIAMFFDEVNEYADAPEEAPAEEETPAEEPAPEEAEETEVSEEAAPEEEEPSEEPVYADEDLSDEEELDDSFLEETPAEEAAEEPKEDEDESLDQADINLMLAFGMDDKLNETIGFDRADRLREKIETTSKLERREPVDFEYTDRSQTQGIATAYKSSRKSTLIKMVIAFAVAAYLLFFENISMLGIQFGGFLDPVLYPVTYIMIGLECGLIACACAYEQIIQGFSKLFKGQPSIETILSVYFVCNLIYSVVLCLSSAKNSNLQLFNAPLALCAGFSLLHDYLAIKREICSFNIVASKKQKYVLRRIPASEGSPEATSCKSDSDILKIEKAGFIDGFFSRICTPDRANAPMIAFLCFAVPVLSIMIGVLAGFLGDNVPGVRTAGATYSIAFPLAILFVSAYPLFRAVRFAFDSDTTMIGEYALREYADATLISMDEDILYPDDSVHVQNIKVYNNYRLDKVMYFAASVFNKVGGPLSAVLGVAAGDIGYSEEVELKRVSKGILTALVDGKEVTFGSAEALITAGFPDVFPEEEEEESGNIRLMYMFREDVLVAQLKIMYDMSPEFAGMMRDMVESGLDICIRSFDPNIDKSLVLSAIGVTVGSVHIVKVAGEESKKTGNERVDAGIVSRESPNGLLQALSYCDEVLGVLSIGQKLLWAATILGLLVTLVLGILGKITVVNSFLVSVYQALWLLPTYFLGRTKIK